MGSMASNRKIILLVGFVAILTRRQCFDWKNIIWLSKPCFCTYICLPVTDCWLDECGPMPRNFGGAQKNLFCPLLKTKKMYIFCLLVRRTVQQFYQSRRVFFQFPTLSPYEEYCANQADAKETLDAVIGREARVRDFLQRCLESPFSRKLDLWSYLDLPRSKLVKYPLLLKNILKATPADHPDTEHLEKAVSVLFARA